MTIRPFCRPNFHARHVGRAYQFLRARTPHHQLSPGPVTVTQLCGGYGLSPQRATGATVRIGVVSLGGGYLPSDIVAMASRDGFMPPTIATHGVRGATNSPGDDADVENVLDIYMSGGVFGYLTGLAAEVLFVSAPNDGRGIADGIAAAVAQGCKYVTLSWGAPYSQWAAADVAYTEAVLTKCVAAGVTVFVAAGDGNASDGTGKPVCDYPACSPSVIAVGGTTLTLSPYREVVWDDAAQEGTGGGYNPAFNRPTWQTIPASFSPAWGRCEPDVALNSDPQTGYPLIVNGITSVIGGTSAAAPGWAGLAAAAVACGGTAQFLGPLLYGNQPLFNDITVGHN